MAVDPYANFVIMKEGKMLDGLIPASGLITGIITLAAGVIVLIWPKVLNYIVGIYLIIVGIMAIVNSKFWA